MLGAQVYSGKTCDISFFSKAPIEDISANNSTSKIIVNTSTNAVAIKVTIKEFSFKKKLMEEHFNEKYMESDKYPYATFAGKIKDTIDYKKDGVYNVTVTGKLMIHGVEQERNIRGTLTIKGGEIMIESKFLVALKDHNIEIPSIVLQNIAEIIQVTINSTLTELKKN